MPQIPATVHLKSQYANKPNFSIEDGEEFRTIALDKTTGILMLFEPDRHEQSFVGLAEDQVETISSDRIDENEFFKVWGQKEAWRETPSPAFDI
jgi:hypothetical protein